MVGFVRCQLKEACYVEDQHDFLKVGKASGIYISAVSFNTAGIFEVAHQVQRQRLHHEFESRYQAYSATQGKKRPTCIHDARSEGIR